MFSFSRHKNVVDFCPKLRRLCDITTPNLAEANQLRTENRYNRAIPTLVCPWCDDLPATDESIACLTSDMSDHGVCLISNHPFSAQTIVVGYWLTREAMTEPWFFIGNVRRHQSIGGGFWTMGVEFSEFANANHADKLATLSILAKDRLEPSELLPA